MRTRAWAGRALGAATWVLLAGVLWSSLAIAEEESLHLREGEDPSAQSLLFTYAVQPGDTLASIALRNNISIERMLSVNPHITDPDRIFPNQEVHLPPPAPGEGGDPIACDLVDLLEAEEIALPIAPIEEHEETERPIYADRVDEAFQAKVIEVSERLEMDPNYLMAIMYYETGGTFSPSIRNPRSDAVGLIQFLPSTARALGTNDSTLEAMSAVEQLDWVERYLERFTGRLTTLEDAYMAVLFPIAVGEPPEFVLFGRGSRSYERNPGLDRDDDGLVTRGEVGEALQGVMDRGQTAMIQQ